MIYISRVGKCAEKSGVVRERIEWESAVNGDTFFSFWGARVCRYKPLKRRLLKE